MNAIDEKYKQFVCKRNKDTESEDFLNSKSKKAFLVRDESILVNLENKLTKFHGYYMLAILILPIVLLSSYVYFLKKYGLNKDYFTPSIFVFVILLIVGLDSCRKYIFEKQLSDYPLTEVKLTDEEKKFLRFRYISGRYVNVFLFLGIIYVLSQWIFIVLDLNELFNFKNIIPLALSFIVLFEVLNIFKNISNKI